MKKCPYCAEEIQEDAIFCRYCGKELINSNERNSDYKASSGLIAIGWVLLVASMIPWGNQTVSIILSLILLGVSIALVTKRNRTSKINGWILLAIWIITFIIGMIYGYTYSSIINKLSSLQFTQPSNSQSNNLHPTTIPSQIPPSANKPANQPKVNTISAPQNPALNTISCDKLIDREAPDLPNVDCDNFDNKGSWNTDSINNAEYQSKYEISGGKLLLNANVQPAAPNYVGGYYGVIQYPSFSSFSTDNFFMSAKLNIPTSDYWSASGLVLTSKESTYYYLIDPMNGNYVILKKDMVADKWRDVTGWKYSEEINRNRANRISIIFNNNITYLYINGNFIRKGKLIENISNGYVGLASYVPYGKSASMEFDDVVLMFK